jgi:hypothetical protein
MMKRVARFSRLKGFDGGLPDSNHPDCRRTLYNVIGFQPPRVERAGKQSPVGKKAARMAAIKISEGFNLGYCRALPGKGPMLHNHDTNETFICMKPLDVISFPPGASRRFMNLKKGPGGRRGVLMFVIGGNAPSAEFTRESMDELERKGVWPAKR